MDSHRRDHPRQSRRPLSIRTVIHRAPIDHLRARVRIVVVESLAIVVHFLPQLIHPLPLPHRRCEYPPPIPHPHQSSLHQYRRGGIIGEYIIPLPQSLHGGRLLGVN